MGRCPRCGAPCGDAEGLPALTCSRKRCAAASIRTRLRSCRSCAAATFLQSARRCRHRSSSSNSAEPPSSAGSGIRMARLRYRYWHRRWGSGARAARTPLRPARPAKGTRPRGERAKTWAGFRAGQGFNRFAAVRARSARFGSRKSCSPLPVLGGLYLIKFIGFSVRTGRFWSLCSFSAPLGTVLAWRTKITRRRIPKVPDFSVFPGAKRLCGKKKQ